ncbi:MAG TPA: hypothetical protein VK081_07705 [Planctomycetota bacterium]|nr:hypothetical protein [Planctomycetota bacterium]
MRARTCKAAACAFLLFAPATAQRGTTWMAEVALDAGVKLSGCAVGDLLPEHPGDEIVAVGADGAVHVVWRERGRWRSAVAVRHPGELVQVAVGDVDPRHPGPEIVAVGMAEGSEDDGGRGAAIVVRRDGDGWRSSPWTADALVHAVTVTGGVALVAGFDHAVHRLRVADGAVTGERVARLPAAAKGMVVLHGVAFVACTDGSVVRVDPGRADPGATAAVDLRGPAGYARIGTDGERLLVAGDDGALTLLVRSGEGWARTELFRDAAKLRGAVLADLDPTRPGIEAATAGYSNKVTLLRERNGRWRGEVLLEDEAPLHSLACGDVDGRPGLELVACGFAGKVHVLRRGAQPVAGPQAGEWQAEVLLDTGVVMGGCAVGDLLPEAGDEIVAVGRDGVIHVLVHTGDEWRHEVVYRGNGELIQVAIGDALPEVPGNEIVAVGVAEGIERDDSPGIAIVVARQDGGWHAERAFLAPALQHGVCVHDGCAFVTGYDRRVHRLTRVDGAWRAELIAELPGDGKGALSTPWGVLVTSTDGSLFRLHKGEHGWQADAVDVRRSPRSRVGSNGTLVITSDNDGTLSLLRPFAEGAWQREEIHREFDLLRGAVLADLDPDLPGDEAATAGYEHKVSLLCRHGGRWWSRMLYRDADRLHHLACGELDGVPGPDLVACGFSGRLILLHRVPP